MLGSDGVRSLTATHRNRAKQIMQRQAEPVLEASNAWWEQSVFGEPSLVGPVGRALVSSLSEVVACRRRHESVVSNLPVRGCIPHKRV